MEKDEIQNNEKIDILDFNKKIGFIMIPNVLFINLVKLNIKPYEYLLLSSLYFFAHQNDSAWPSIKTLQRLTGISHFGIRKLFNSLEKKGYIVKKRRRSKEKGNISNLYSFKPLNNILENIMTNELIEAQKTNIPLSNEVAYPKQQGCEPLSNEVAYPKQQGCEPLSNEVAYPKQQGCEPLSNEVAYPKQQGCEPLSNEVAPKNTYIEEYIMKNNKIEEETAFSENEIVKSVLDYLNIKTGKHFTFKNKANLENITARLKDGFKVEQLKLVIDKKTAEWLSSQEMNQYLNPITLFRPTKFEKYLNSNIQTGEPDKYKNLKLTHFNPDTGETWVTGGE